MTFTLSCFLLESRFGGIVVRYIVNLVRLVVIRRHDRAANDGRRKRFFEALLMKNIRLYNTYTCISYSHCGKKLAMDVLKILPSATNFQFTSLNKSGEKSERILRRRNQRKFKQIFSFIFRFSVFKIFHLLYHRHFSLTLGIGRKRYLSAELCKRFPLVTKHHIRIAPST